MIVQLEKGFFPPEAPDPIRDLCWDAHEVLAAYMEEGVDLGTPEDISERDEEDGEGVCIHETALLQVNESQALCLSNAPQLLQDDGRSDWYLSPGYVALRVEPAEDSPVDDRRDLDDTCRQIVFQLPQPGSEAAIYDGYELEECNRITPEQTKLLKNLDMVIKAMRRGYREMMEDNSEARSNAYFSQVPSKAIADEFADFLKNPLG